MANREFLMLAKTYDPSKHRISGWFASVKYDGVRAFWDGGVSKGWPVEEIPWANKNGPTVATGLWSRYANVIHAPDWWLDKLPKGVTLDGELWMGRRMFQSTVSVVKRFVGDARWSEVQYLVFESPPAEVIFQNGRISGVNLKKTIYSEECLSIYRAMGGVVGGGIRVFNDVQCAIDGIEQTQLPWSETEAREQLQEMLVEECANGGEGLMLRSPGSVYDVRRSNYLLKVKKIDPASGNVVGWLPGEGKYSGMMGSLTVKIRTGMFQLSGFTDEERRLVGGWPAMFPKGTIVRFIHSGATNDGLPREARYFRA